MPIPFILGGLAVLAGAVGIGAGIDASDTIKAAKGMVEDAKKKHKEKSEELEERVKEVQSKAVELGMLKKEIFETSVPRFIKLYQKFNKIAMKENEDQEGVFDVLQFTPEEVKEFKAQRTAYIETASLALGSGAAAGVASSMGTLGLVGTFGAASTGTAISTLSGVAASNATLAWLGGGSLAAGGMGVAGGTAVLGGILLGPAIAIGGIVMNFKANKAFDQAMDYEQQVDEACEKMDTAIAILDAIDMRIAEISAVLTQLNNRLLKAISKVEAIDNLLKKRFKYLWRRILFISYQYDPEDLTEKGEEFVFKMLRIAKGVKSVLETPVIDKKGEASKESEKIISEASRLLPKAKENTNGTEE
jgi:prefoldin subunit 5